MGDEGAAPLSGELNVPDPQIPEGPGPRLHEAHGETVAAFMDGTGTCSGDRKKMQMAAKLRQKVSSWPSVRHEARPAACPPGHGDLQPGDWTCGMDRKPEMGLLRAVWEWGSLLSTYYIQGFHRL